MSCFTLGPSIYTFTSKYCTSIHPPNIISLPVSPLLSPLQIPRPYQTTYRCTSPFSPHPPKTKKIRTHTHTPQTSFHFPVPKSKCSEVDQFSLADSQATQTLAHTPPAAHAAGVLRAVAAVDAGSARAAGSRGAACACCCGVAAVETGLLLGLGGDDVGVLVLRTRLRLLLLLAGGGVVALVGPISVPAGVVVVWGVIAVRNAKQVALAVELVTTRFVLCVPLAAGWRHADWRCHSPWDSVWSTAAAVVGIVVVFLFVGDDHDDHPYADRAPGPDQWCTVDPPRPSLSGVVVENGAAPLVASGQAPIATATRRVRADGGDPADFGGDASAFC